MSLSDTANQTSRLRSNLFFGLTLCIMCIIFWFSSMNGNESTSQSSFFSNTFMNICNTILSVFGGNIVCTADLSSFIIRKTAHFVIYMVLGFCTNSGFITRGKKKVVFSVISLIICGLYAGSDEFHQSFSDGRTPMATDVILDSLGALCGILISKLIFKPKHIAYARYF